MNVCFRSLSELRRSRPADLPPLLKTWKTLSESLRHLNAVSVQAPDEVWEAAEPHGPLARVPILVKDNINVRGLSTTAGSLHLSAHAQSTDAPVVAALRKAGAIIAAKTTLSELSGFVSTSLPGGYSQRFGRTVNSRFPGENPGGSSSGAASAVAAGLAPLALGTETNGSIIMPAMRHRIIGFKPTHGLIPAEGVVPISHHFDTPGVLANDCRDVGVFLRVFSVDIPHVAKPVRRIGLVVPSRGVPHAALHRFKRAAATASLEVVEVRFPTPFASYKVICSHDIQLDMTQWLQRYGDGSTNDFHALVESYRQSGHPFGFDRLDDADRFQGKDARRLYKQALEERLLLIEALDGLFRAEAIDAVVVFSYETHWAMTGFPHITIPWDGDNLLIGMKRGEDERLVTFAQRLSELRAGQ